MKTIRLTALFGIILLLVTSMTVSGCVLGNPAIPDDVKKETRNVGEFTKLEVSGAFDVILTQGDKCEVVIEADADVIDNVITSVSGSKLEISVKNCPNHVDVLTAYLTFKNLEDIELSGAVELKTETRLKTDKLFLDVSGATETELMLEVNSFESDCSGASEMTLSGFAQSVDMDISGASEVDALELEATDFDLEVSGASEARVYVKNELRVESSGASEVRYKGSPKVYSESSGASTIKPL